jgi:hypothetical protein
MYKVVARKSLENSYKMTCDYERLQCCMCDP